MNHISTVFRIDVRIKGVIEEKIQDHHLARKKFIEQFCFCSKMFKCSEPTEKWIPEYGLVAV